MEQQTTTPKKSNPLMSIVLITVLIVIAAIFGAQKRAPAPAENPSPIEPVAATPQDLCYYSSTDAPHGLKDIYWIRMTLTDGATKNGNVSGEFRSLPAEKDSKVGPFTGTISALPATAADGTIDAWWSASAEGMTTTEQLALKYDDKKISAGFGEMIDRGDGTYVYKNPSAITYGKEIPAVDCGNLNEMLTVEKYIRDNIATLSPIKATAGGTWYVIRVDTDTTKKTGTVKYEDGHLQESKSFTYTMNAAGAVQSVTIAK